MLVSAKYQHESAIGIHTSPPSWISHPSLSPSHPSRLLEPRFEFPESYSKFPLALYFTYGNMFPCSVQYSSVTQLCPTLCDPMGCSTSGFPVHHRLLNLAQTHVYRVSDAIHPSHSLTFPSPPACNLSQHQGLFQWVSSSNQMAKVLELQLQHQSFQWIFRVDFL